MAEFPGALDYFVDRSRVFVEQNDHKAIVLHCTGGDASQTVEQLGDYFRTTSLLTSVHYGIDRAGKMAQYVLERDGAAGNCCTETGHDPFWSQFGGDNLNVHTLSIECINDRENSLPLTAAQERALFDLVSYLCKKYDIPVSNIKTHQSIAPIARAHCPGSAFPFDALSAYLQQEGDTAMHISDPFAQRYFVDRGGGRWHCSKTGCDVLGAILTFYCHIWGAVRLPRSGEQYDVAGIVYQRFESGIIVYDPQHLYDNPTGFEECYLLKLDTPLAKRILASS